MHHILTIQKYTGSVFSEIHYFGPCTRKRTCLIASDKRDLFSTIKRQRRRTSCCGVDRHYQDVQQRGGESRRQLRPSADRGFIRHDLLNTLTETLIKHAMLNIKIFKILFGNEDEDVEVTEDMTSPSPPFNNVDFDHLRNWFSSQTHYVIQRTGAFKSNKTHTYAESSG